MPTNPLSIPGGWSKETPTNEKANPVDTQDQQEVPRSASGVVSEAGDVVDQGGNAIGSVADSKNPQELVGNTVTATGDIVNSGGDVLGKATVGDTGSGGSGDEYTTQTQEEAEKKASGGWFGKTKGLFNTVQGVGKPVANGLGAISGSGKAEQQIDSTQESATEKTPDVTADTSVENVEGAKNDTCAKAGEAAEGVTEDAKNDDTCTKAGETAGETAEGVKGDAEGVTEDAKNNDSCTKAGETVEGAKDDAQDAAEGVKGDIPDASDAQDAQNAPDAQDVAEDAKDNVPDAPDASEAQDVAEGVQEDAPDAPDAPVQLEDRKGDEADKDQPEENKELEQAEGEVAGATEIPEADKDAENQAGEEEEPVDYSMLEGTTVNKIGNLVDKDGNAVGRLVEGDAKQLKGKKADGNGDIWNDSGKVVGKAEPIPQSELDSAKDFAPFENFPDAIVEADGRVTSNGQQVGTVVEGDPKRLKGSKVDEDGDILDRNGNTVGKAEAWDEPEAIQEEEPDRSILAGKRVNKAGNVVDQSGAIFGKVVEGNVSSMVGRMCDKDGNVRSESGDVLGKAEVVPEGEREGSKEGPFAELEGLTVTKDGKVVTPSGDVVGRLTSGDGKALFGRSVDEDGDVLDKNGNVLGKAERWEEPEVEKKKGPMAGRKVNREGNVVDEDGNIIGKLVNGDLTTCAGKEIDDDGDVINSKGNTVGHVALLEDIPPEEESAEEKEAREQAEKDKKLAQQLAGSIEQSLEKIRPILKMITDKVDKAERTPKEELDEEQLVKEVKPLIEEGGKILTETNGMIRGMDPDGRIQRNAKHKSSTKEASPEEHHLAEVLKELTGTVTETIDNAKRKIEDMPHASKELNPLWGLLMEPLGQILAAVGLLLNGVLGLVGRLLSGLGLGGLVDGLLGGLGLDKILGSFGLSSAYDALVGKDQKK